jgi:hypothetical protein
LYAWGSVGLWKAISVGSCRDRDDPGPNSARSPIGVLGHSTIDDIYPSNAAVPHLNPVAAPRRRGCARRPFGSLCRVSLPLFRPRAGTCLCRRRPAPAVWLQKTKVLPPLRMPLLSLIVVESRLFSFVCLCRWRRTIATMRPDRSTTPDCFALGHCTQTQQILWALKRLFDTGHSLLTGKSASRERLMLSAVYHRDLKILVENFHAVDAADCGRHRQAHGLAQALLGRNRAMRHQFTTASQTFHAACLAGERQCWRRRNSQIDPVTRLRPLSR